jgi:hypothetical protein
MEAKGLTPMDVVNAVNTQNILDCLIIGGLCDRFDNTYRDRYQEGAQVGVRPGPTPLFGG